MTEPRIYVGDGAPDREVVQVHGLVHTTVPSAQNVMGSRAARSFDDDIDEALRKLGIAAQRLGANAVRHVSIQTTERGSGFMFVTVYGDAVRLK